MTQVQTFTSGRKTIELHAVRGDAAGVRIWTTTEVSGGGSGGGYVNQGTGYVAPTAAVKTKHTEHCQFFVRTGDGRELSVKLDDAGIVLRDGQPVSLVFGVKAGKQGGHYVAIHNHATNQTTMLNKNVSRLVGASAPLVVFLLVIFAGGAIAGWIGFEDMMGPGPFIKDVPLTVLGFGIAWLMGLSLWKRIKRWRALHATVGGVVEQIRSNK